MRVIQEYAKEKYRNFSIFAHPDFVNQDIIYEVKYTTADFQQTAKDYASTGSMVLYLMPKGNVFLLKGTQGRDLNFKLLGILHTLKKSDNIVDAILQGINLIDDFCDSKLS